jgi:hypothetical protein
VDDNDEVNDEECRRVYFGNWVNIFTSLSMNMK